MKNVRRVLQRAINLIAENEEEFSCNAIFTAECRINNLQFSFPHADGPIENLYREVFSYRLNRSRSPDPLLYAVEWSASNDDEVRKLRLLMLSLFLVAYKDFI